MDDCSTGAGNIQDETMRLKNSCHVRNKGSAQKKKKKKTHKKTQTSQNPHLTEGGMSKGHWPIERTHNGQEWDNLIKIKF